MRVPSFAVFDHNTPTGPIAVPIAIAHGTADPLIPIALSEQEVARRCRQGETIQLARLPGASHDAREDSAGYLMGWVLDRFEGREAPESCPMESERPKAGEGI